MTFTAFIDWPGTPLTDSLVRRSLSRLSPGPTVVSSLSPDTNRPLLQWSTYDAIDHELTPSEPKSILSSSYTIRKALIRKHFLHRCIVAYTTKNPNSILHSSIPKTWDIEIAYADELDDALWADELWELGEELQKGDSKWFILKPGMADRGMGIRLFNSKEALEKIFEDFEEDSDDEIENDTNVVTSQLRHFVIQEYAPRPVLVDPRENRIQSDGGKGNQNDNLKGYKFHLRAYCVASGALSVYLYPRVLALFSSEAYVAPSKSENQHGDIDLRPHLTNTCLQAETGDEYVRLLDELVGLDVLSGVDDKQEKISKDDIDNLKRQMSEVLAETFRAAVQMPVHFQPLPNAFELFGVDFLVVHNESRENNGSKFQVKLLEINAEPAIEMTGPRLKWILEDLFDLIGENCVKPFFENITGADARVEAWTL